MPLVGRKLMSEARRTLVPGNNSSGVTVPVGALDGGRSRNLFNELSNNAEAPLQLLPKQLSYVLPLQAVVALIRERGLQINLGCATRIFRKLHGIT